jgi:acetyltransferase-like isoleucine patch superfamily enzyme
MISNLVTIANGDRHPIFDVNTNEQINKNKSIVLEDHVLLRNKCTIMSRSKIGEGSVVGDNSLVKNEFHNNCIIMGIPAKLIRKDIVWDRKIDNFNCIIDKPYWNKTHWKIKLKNNER